GNAVALVEHQAGCFLFEFRGKRTSLSSHRTPLNGEHCRLSGCPVSLDHYKLIYRQSWRSREAVEIATLKWVHWYNHQRLLSSIGYIPPAEAEANFYQQQSGQTMAA